MELSEEHRMTTEDPLSTEPRVNGRPLSAGASLDDDVLDAIAQRVLWTATAMIDAANRGCSTPSTT